MGKKHDGLKRSPGGSGSSLSPFKRAIWFAGRHCSWVRRAYHKHTGRYLWGLLWLLADGRWEEHERKLQL